MNLFFGQAIWQRLSHLIHLVLCATLIISAPTAAQQSQASTISEIKVTGSFISRDANDHKLSTRVLDRSYINAIGATSMSDIISTLAVSSGAENQTDSLTQGFTQGTGNVNLRGLGLSSTLVLINGRRQTLSGALANDGSVFVDTTSLPISALERVEIVKEGATSSYGSDAIAGVVNFILRSDFDGFELTARTQQVHEGDQHDHTFGLLWGTSNEKTHFMVAADYLHRSALSATDRPGLTGNAVSTLGSSFTTKSAAVVVSGPYAGTYTEEQTLPNARCADYAEAVSIGTLCGFSYGPRFNLIAAETRGQFYANLKHEFSPKMRLTSEFGLSRNKVTENPQSPSYPDLTFPTISADHPSNPLGVDLTWLGRPFAFGYPSPNAPRENNTYRASLNLQGDWHNDWQWDAAITHSGNQYTIYQPDTIASRLQAAFMGQGGPDGNAYYDPFIPENNTQSLYDYLAYQTEVKRKTDLTVVDFVFDGELLTLSTGAAVDLAMGIQVRRESYQTQADDLYEITFDENGNPQPVDLIFLGGVSELDQTRSSFSAFTEVRIPLGDTIEVTSALRYENLDSGRSIDPKLAVLWTISDKLALRASISTAFREPSLSQIHAQTVQLERIQDYNSDGSAKGGAAFVRVVQSGSQQLKAEESDNFNLGVVLTPSPSVDIQLDFWAIDYSNLITIENAQGKVTANSFDEDIIRGDGGVLAGVIVDYFNASRVDVQGTDLTARWTFSPSMSLGVDLSHLINYEITLPNGTTLDAAGELNRTNFARSLPKTKATVALNWAHENQSANIIVQHVSAYKNGAENIGVFSTVDARYQTRLAPEKTPGAFTINIGVKNLLNESPPIVTDSGNFSFDARQHNVLGRTLYVGGKYTF